MSLGERGSCVQSQLSVAGYNAIAGKNGKKNPKVNGLGHLFNVPASLRVFAAFSDSYVALLGTFTALKTLFCGGQALPQ